MRLRDELTFSSGDADEKEEVIMDQNLWCSEVNAGLSSGKREVVVGYALTSKKIKSFLQPKLECLARNKGIHFVAIDHNRSLSDQGPFDIVLQKLSGKEWRQILESACSIFRYESLTSSSGGGLKVQANEDVTTFMAI